LKKTKTILTIQQLAELRGYPDTKKLAEEALKNGLSSIIAGNPHVYLEDWDEYVLKSAAAQLSQRKKSSKSLADTDQMGIIKSNLKRLPESIRSKERKLKTSQALLKSASSDNERDSLRTEISKLKNELFTHKENLKKAKARQKQLLAQRSAELDAQEAEDNKADDSTSDENKSTGESASK